MATRIAISHGVATSTFHNLITNESGWNEREFSNGEDRGIAQISKRWHPEVSDECAFDAECAMTWAAQRIKDGYIHEWVVCNCYAFVKTKIPTLPKTKDLVPNIGNPVPGGVAIFDYNGVKHYAYIQSVVQGSFVVSEANYEPCALGKRTILTTDSALVGYWVK